VNEAARGSIGFRRFECKPIQIAHLSGLNDWFHVGVCADYSHLGVNNIVDLKA